MAFRRYGKPKMRSQKMVVDNIEFASATEGETYKWLKAKQDSGEISNLTTQPKFILFPRRKLTMLNRLPQFDPQSSVVYTADFMFLNNATGRMTVVESKGHADKAFKLRACLFLELHSKDYDYLIVTAVWKTRNKVLYLESLNEHWYYPYIEQPKLRKKTK